MWSLFSSLTALFAILNINNPSIDPNQQEFDPSRSYDFIIIGAGSSGSVLARRLSQSFSVLLLEAGSLDTELQMMIQIPALFWTLQGSQADWKYATTTQQYACLRTAGNCEYPRGKTLGGSSSINAMLYTRGYDYDYDRWVQGGADGWGYQNISKYFDQVEETVSVEHLKYNTPLAKEYIEAGKEFGFLNTQCNETYKDCIYKTQNTLRKNFRCSAYKAYLENYQSNKLNILDRALVTKLIINSNFAEGVEFERYGETFRVRAVKEVILSAGAINSPQLLMLSGIGPAKHLKKHNIKTIVDLPVGKNLQDHTRVAIFYTLNVTYPITTDDLLSNETLKLFEEEGTGPLSSTGLEAMAFFKTNSASLKPPDIQFTFSSYVPMPNAVRAIGVAVTATRPKSVGSVKLKDADPHSPPLINPKYFSKKKDFEKTIEGLRKGHSIINSTTFAKYNPQIFPRFLCTNLDLEDFFVCLARYHSLTNYHPVGTVRMGKAGDKTSVVDPELKLIGIKGLRVADASIAPSLPSANINAMALMIGEKAADLILNEHLNKL